MNGIRTMMLLAGMTALFMGVGYLIGGGGGLVIAFVVAVAMNGYAYWNSDKLALRMHNAEPVARTHPLYEMTARLARDAGMPEPAVYVINSDQPNAFATGRSPENAAVAATTGIMRLLDREELEGVMAHELAHIKNRDTLTMTIAATVAGAITMLANIAQFQMMFGGNRDRGPLGMIGLLLAVFLAPMAAMVVQMAISRTREYSADREGAIIANNPMGLAKALRKISSAASRIEMQTAERNPGSAHMFIINPLTRGGMDNLFSTHPNPANRIAALEAMAQGGGGSGPSYRESSIPVSGRTMDRRR